MNPPEIWKPINRFNGCYEVSNLGRVKRLAGKFEWRPTEKILSAHTNEHGYKRIGLRVPGGKQIKVYVHQLVAEAFIGPCPEGKEVNHKDTNKGNNRWDNLEYLTPTENMEHAIANGLHPSGEQHHYSRRPETIRKGSAHPMSRLTDADVLEIRNALSRGVPQKQLARTYAVTKTTIYGIKYRKTWAHI